MITDVRGDLLSDDAEAIVNTVNTEGVMGKGIALQFKQRYPANFAAYRAACKRGEVRLGSMFVVPTGALEGPRYIVNFPTKGHWRERSRMSEVEAGLRDLVKVVRELGIRSIALPPLGCGNGGLEWSEVRPLIVNALDELPGLDVRLYGPEGAPAPAAMVTTTTKPTMTLARSVVVCLLDRYLRGRRGASRLEVQKLAYFAETAGVPLRLEFVRAQYGPYAEKLNHVLAGMEGHFTVGYGDRSGASDLRVVEPELLAARNFVADRPDVAEALERVATLVEDFDSPYGLELLSTVHYVVRADGVDPADAAAIAVAVRSWSDRKKHLFTDHHIGVARERLAVNGWLGRLAPAPLASATPGSAT
jgi:O-acetyl-ADP-ribose deacetylase (regulator of RNase III)